MELNNTELNDIIKNYESKSNKDLVKALDVLKEDFDKTKNTIINLTYHLDMVEDLYNKLSNELERRANGG